MSTLPDRLVLTNYQLHLPTFEGPLDLLLKLIEKAELPISEVSLISVTGQFLAHVEELGGIRPEALAEFTAIGARLVLLKSRSLLPRPAETAEDDFGEELVTRLLEYQSAKAAALLLAEKQQSGQRAYVRLASVTAPASDQMAPLARHQAVSLARAIRRRFSALPSPRTLVDGRERVPIRVMLERALSTVLPGGRYRFQDVVGPSPTREEAMTAFLAVLILMRRRMFDAEQEGPFEPIDLWRTSETDISLTELIPAEALSEIA